MYLGGDGAIELLIFSLRWKFNKILGLKHPENHIISNLTRLHFITDTSAFHKWTKKPKLNFIMSAPVADCNSNCCW